MNKLEKLKQLLDQASEKQLSFTKIKVYGYQYNYEVSLIKSISKFWFGRHEVTDYFAPSNQESNHNNRPGIFKKSIEYIVIHDTASVAKSADEYAQASLYRQQGISAEYKSSLGTAVEILDRLGLGDLDWGQGFLDGKISFFRQHLALGRTGRYSRSMSASSACCSRARCV